MRSSSHITSNSQAELKEHVVFDSQITFEFNTPFLAKSLRDKIVELYPSVFQNEFRNRFSEYSLLINLVESTGPPMLSRSSLQLRLQGG